jgi:hypothetical protein
MATIRRKTATKATVQSTKPVRELQDATDVDFGTLNAAADGKVVSYDNTTGKFVLIDADTILGRSSEDGNLSDEFITQIETQIDLGDSQENIDGGAFS